MLFFLCFRPTIKFQDGSPVDPLLEPPADPPFDSIVRPQKWEDSQVGFQGSNASGRRIVLLPGAFWAHGASKMAILGATFLLCILQCFRVWEGMLPPGACRMSHASARRVVWCRGLCVSSLCSQIPLAPAPRFGAFRLDLSKIIFVVISASLILLEFGTRKKRCDNDTFRAVFPNIWISCECQALQNNGKRKMPNRPCSLSPQEGSPRQAVGGHTAEAQQRYFPYRAILVAIVSQNSFVAALRKGPPFYGSRSSREIKIQNESCQMAGREVTR